jgi:hypothetical protein
MHASLSRYLRYLEPGLAHLGPEPVRLVVHIVGPAEIPEMASDMPTPTLRGRYRVARRGDRLLYSLDRQGFLRLDLGERTASIWTTAHHPRDLDLVASLVSIAVLELVSRRGLFGLHAAAVARDGVGYLLPGPSGSGKTSLCLTLVRDGFRYVTDDFLLLTAGAGDIRCLPFFRTFNLDVAWATRFPELSFVQDLPPLPNGKRMFDPELCYPGSRAAAFRPACLLFPTIVTRAESTVRPISQQDALCRLLPQSRLSADPGTAEAHVRALGALARDSAAFELQHGRDFLGAPVETLRRLLEPLRPHTPAPGPR